MKIPDHDQTSSVSTRPIQDHIDLIACHNVFLGPGILPDPSDIRILGLQDLRDPALDHLIGNGLHILLGMNLGFLRFRKGQHRRSRFNLLGRQEQ